MMKDSYITQVRGDGLSIGIPKKVAKNLDLKAEDYVKVVIKKVEMNDE